jgi:hypothetical protein
MKQYFYPILFIFLMNFSSVAVFAQDMAADGIDTFIEEQKRKHNRFIGLKMNNGIILPTDEFTKTFNSPYYHSLSLRLGFRPTGDSWMDFAYGMPYVGFGLYVADFPTKREVFGNPIALYIFHGGTIHNFSPRFSLHYEWNLGVAFNWKHYDPFTNPENIVIGSSNTAFASVNAYTKWRLTPRVDVNLGLGVNHFSNGSTRLPNSGMNLFAPFVELTYALDSKEKEIRQIVPIAPPTKFKPRLDYDFAFTLSSRQIKVDTVGTGMPSIYFNYNFPILGFSFTPLIVPNHKYKYGVGLDIVHDKSINAKVWREMNPLDGHMYDRVKFAPTMEQFTVGLSARGEITMPLYTFFTNIGYNVVQQTDARRGYQLIGIKVYPRENLYATFAVKATHFSRAQYIAWSLGYTLEGKPISRNRQF